MGLNTALGPAAHAAEHAAMGNVVTAETNPVTGGINIQVGTVSMPVYPPDAVGNMAILGVKKAPRMVVWGDSTAAQNAVTNGALLGSAFAYLGNYYAKNPCDIVGVSGNSGNRTDQIIPNFTSQVAIYTPDFVLLSVATNDIVQGYTADYAINGVMTMAAQCESIGAIPILMTIAAGETFSGNEALRPAWLDFNTKLRALALSLGYPLFDAMYSYLDTASATYAPLPGHTDGGVHSINKGGQMLGQTLSQLLKNLPKRQLHDPVAATANLCGNPLLTGTSGSLQAGATGQAPTGCTLQLAGGGGYSAVSSIVPRTDGGAGNWWEAAFSAAPGQSPTFILPTQTLAQIGAVVGDTVRFVVDVELDAGHVGVLSVNAWLRFVGGSIGGAYAYSAQSSNGSMAAGSHKMQLRVPEFAIPSGTTSLALYVLPSAAGGDPCQATVRIGSPSGKKV